MSDKINLQDHFNKVIEKTGATDADAVVTLVIRESQTGIHISGRDMLNDITIATTLRHLLETEFSAADGMSKVLLAAGNMCISREPIELDKDAEVTDANEIGEMLANAISHLLDGIPEDPDDPQE